MLHSILIASIYATAGICGLCVFTHANGQFYVRVRADRHAIVDLLIAGGYLAVGTLVH